MTPPTAMNTMTPALRLTARTLTSLADQLDDPDGGGTINLHHLATLAHIEQSLNLFIDDAVLEARNDNTANWAQIGIILGIPARAAQNRYATPTKLKDKKMRGKARRTSMSD